MRFWDASAVVPLLVGESVSNACRAVFRDDPHLLVWWGTEVECASAISRREREGSFDDATADFAYDRLDALRERWDEVQPVAAIRDHARRLMRVHPLRATDSLQLAAALVACEFRPPSLRFVCLDQRLARTASREGLRVVTPA